MSDSMDFDQDAGTVARAEVDEAIGQTIEEAEKNLSRHSNKDSSQPVAEQERTTI